jgi:hemerythrin
MSGSAGATSSDVGNAGWRLRPRPFFVWKDAFGLGIPQVDRDHQEFFEILNRLQYCVVLGKEEAVVRACLGELIAYAREHFAHEEQALDDVAYPYLAEHQAQHRYFLRELERIERQSTSAIRAVSLAREWLLEHILETDKKYARWFAARGAVD